MPQTNVGGAKAVVLKVHLMVQAEKPFLGWHWKNLKDKRFKHVGIGVWTRTPSSGTT